MVLGPFVVESRVFNCGSSEKDWASLKSVFVANELRVIDPANSKFAIVRYDSTRKNDAHRWLRSVVYDKETLKPVCVAPPKATALPRTDWSEMIGVDAQDFVDGTMINIFWPSSGEPQVVTRSRLGADNRFYGELSFLDMLKEALTRYSTTNKGFSGELADLKPFEGGGFISAVLQHPSNRVVTEVKDASITVVHVGSVGEDGSVTIDEDPENWSDNLRYLAPGKLTIPAEKLSSYEELTAYVETQSTSFGYMWQGYVLKNGTGARYRLRSKVYSQVRSLRGNESDALMRFSRLRGEKSIKRYLKYYPEDEKVFYELEGRLRNCTRRLLDFYVNTFKFKKTEFHTLPWPYKHHVSVLHNQFKEKLKPNRKTIDITYVIEYINSLPVEDMGNLFKEPKEKRVVAAAATATVAAAS